jgi:hypothetical protein
MGTLKLGAQMSIIQRQLVDQLILEIIAERGAVHLQNIAEEVYAKWAEYDEPTIEFMTLARVAHLSATHQITNVTGEWFYYQIEESDA